MKKLLLSLFILLLVGNNAFAVTIGGNDWRQLTDTTNISWHDLDIIYDITSGELDTTVKNIGGVDFDAWTWSSAADVSAMMFAATGLIAPVGSHIIEFDSLWAPKFITYFDPTDYMSGYVENVKGWTRDLTVGGYEGGLYQLSNTYPAYGGGTIADSSYFGDDDIYRMQATKGVYLYRAAPVPEPTTMILFGMGLLSLAGVSRKKRK